MLDLVMLDLMMIGINDFSIYLCKKIAHSTKNIIAIAMTGTLTSGNVKKIIEFFGALTSFDKPVNLHY